MKTYVGGASFITVGELTKYLGQTNTSRVKQKYLTNEFRLTGTKSYFIPEIAKKVYAEGSWE